MWIYSYFFFTLYEHNGGRCLDSGVGMPKNLYLDSNVILSYFFVCKCSATVPAGRRRTTGCRDVAFIWRKKNVQLGTWYTGRSGRVSGRWLITTRDNIVSAMIYARWAVGVSGDGGYKYLETDVSDALNAAPGCRYKTIITPFAVRYTGCRRRRRETLISGHKSRNTGGPSYVSRRHIIPRAPAPARFNLTRTAPGRRGIIRRTRSECCAQGEFFGRIRPSVLHSPGMHGCPAEFDEFVVGFGFPCTRRTFRSVAFWHARFYPGNFWNLLNRVKLCQARFARGLTNFCTTTVRYNVYFGDTHKRHGTSRPFYPCSRLCCVHGVKRAA